MNLWSKSHDITTFKMNYLLPYFQHGTIYGVFSRNVTSVIFDKTAAKLVSHTSSALLSFSAFYLVCSSNFLSPCTKSYDITIHMNSLQQYFHLFTDILQSEIGKSCRILTLGSVSNNDGDGYENVT